MTIETVNPDPENVETIEIPVGQTAEGEQVVETPAETEEEALPEGDTFPRAYVEDLRAEAGKHRTAAKEAQAALVPLQERLFGLLVAGTGRLADPTDLPFDAALLESDEALTKAIDDLLERKPHLASRTVSGDIGQGGGQPAESGVLLGLVNAGA